MRSSTLRAAALLSLTAEGIAADKSLLKGYAAIKSGDGFLAVPVGTVDRPKSGRRRAASGFEDKLYNMDYFYATDVNLGNPPQTVTVLVDTGSSELWVNPDCRTARSSDQAQQCVKFGRYDPDKSTTPALGPFGQEELNYGDPTDTSTQTSALIYYYADVVALGGAKIKNQTFGVVARSKGQSQGILGLAPDLKGGFDTDQPYPLVLSSMAEQGVIASRVFSLDLRHADSDYGAVVYGGVDRSKFIGALEKRPMVKGIGGEYRLAVELSTVGITNSKGQSSNFKVQGQDANVMLDSGSTVSRMHAAVARPLLDALDAQSDGEGYYQVPCSLKNVGGSVDFGFGNKVVRIPLKDFIVDLGSDSSMCFVGLVLTTDQQILGDTVLRAGYFVFDWDNQQVHVAQAANCGDNDIVAVGSGKDSVPSSTGNCKESDAVFTGGAPSPTQTKKGSSPTKAYTTVYTITSCPHFDLTCETGVVTTQTVSAAATDIGGSGGISGDGGGDDSAGVHHEAMTMLLLILGALSVVYNVL